LTSNKGEGIKTRKAVIRDFKKLIKQHLLRKIRVDKEGSIYLNIGSAVTYHIVILKREKLFKKNKPFIFWVEEVYFEPADIEDPKEMLFDESNVINW